MTDNRVLALDLSLSSPGFAVLATSDVDGARKPVILEASHVKTNARRPHGYRLAQIEAEMERLIVFYKPKHIVRERGFSRFAATTQAIFRVVGVSDLIAQRHGIEKIAEITPTSVKKIVTGNGKASKGDVQQAVMRALSIEQEDYFANDDESDAAACGLAYMVQEGIISI